MNNYRTQSVENRSLYYPSILCELMKSKTQWPKLIIDIVLNVPLSLKNEWAGKNPPQPPSSKGAKSGMTKG